MNRWTEQEAQETSPGWFSELDREVAVPTGHGPITTGLSWQAGPPPLLHLSNSPSPCKPKSQMVPPP